MRKLCVLDTSVLIHDPLSFKNFPEYDVIIPIAVLDELDKLKTLPNEAGKNARICIRNLDLTENSDYFQIDTFTYSDKFGSQNYADNKILACAHNLKKKNKTTTLITQDINLRVRAKALGILSQDYLKDKNKNAQEIYTGIKEIVSNELGTRLKRESLNCTVSEELEILHPNQCVHFVSDKNNGLSIGKRIGDRIVQILPQKPWGLETRSVEQALAADLIMDSKIPLVTLLGRSGTGKSLLALACSLELVLERKQYQKLIIYRPIQPVGKDLGFMPGSLSDKLHVWMTAIYDSMEFLLSSQKGDKWKTMLEMYKEKEIIQLDALTYIRGRSINNALIILDEAQNVNTTEIKTLLTRVGHDSKIILNGDVEQIDTNLDCHNNGLSYVVEKFKPSKLSGHITFRKCERSPLAEEAANLL